GGAPRGARPRSQGGAGRLASASACRVMVRQGCLASTPRRLGALLPVIRGKEKGIRGARARASAGCAERWLPPFAKASAGTQSVEALAKTDGCLTSEANVARMKRQRNPGRPFRAERIPD